MAAKLNLSDEQKQKIKEIRMRHRNEIQEEVKGKPNMDKQTRRKIMMEHLKSSDAEIQALLTPEQLSIYQQEKERIRKEHMEKRAQGKGRKKDAKGKEADSEEKELEDALVDSL